MAFAPDLEYLDKTGDQVFVGSSVEFEGQCCEVVTESACACSYFSSSQVVPYRKMLLTCSLF